ncbi:MAG: phenylalanine--tRNA ligase subunit beta [Saprospiraceae bacterium]
MKISHNWLKELMPHNFTTEIISETLTDIGLEVEGVNIVESIKGGLKGVIIGQVMTCEKHPNADKLSLTTVNIGGHTNLSIVCGAPNVATGQKVLVATVGTELYDEKGDAFTIKEAKVRGELSQGMICAEDELGLGKSHEGIMILPEDSVVGTKASDYFNIDSDEVFEIGLTPNRADANSHFGTARDLWAALNIHKGYDTSLARPKILSIEGKVASPFKVTIENTESCKRYTGIVLENVRVQDSPDWLKIRLESIGQRPVNNIVDITNYVMFELGQPLHAFDADKIDGQHLKIKNLPQGTEFTALDGSVKSLDKDDLIICDGTDRPLCIAGVYGGLDSGVSQDTTNIFLESAYFSPTPVRKTSFRHNLRTESAAHFEKGTDQHQCLEALLRAALMITEISGAHSNSQYIDNFPNPLPLAVAEIHTEKVRSLIGKSIPNGEIQLILESLSMIIDKVDENKWNITIPSYKTDVHRQADIIEEIVRIYGLNNIESAKKFSFSMPEQLANDSMTSRQIAMQYLADSGYSEAMGLSIINSTQWSKITKNENFEGVRINNTSNVQLDLMRPEALATALEVVAHNQSRQQNDIRMYEYGRSYNVTDQKEYKEDEYISIFGTGSLWDESWAIKTKDSFDSFYLKTTILNLLKRLNVTKFQEKKLTGDPRFEDAIELTMGPRRIAVLGEVSKSWLKASGIKGNMTFGQVYWENVIEMINNKPIKFKEFSKFPVVRRDLAVIVGAEVTYESIRLLANKTLSNYLTNMKLFDIYSNEEQLGKGKRSMSIAFYFTNSVKTFEEKEIEDMMKKLIETLESKVDAFIRK